MLQGILLIDVVEMLSRSESIHYEYGSVEQGLCRIEEMVRRGSEAGLPVYATVYRPKGEEGNVLHPKVRDFVTPEKVFIKTTQKAFSNGGLHSGLQQDGVDALVVAGFSRDACIGLNCEEAINLGYQIITSEHLMFCWTPEARIRAVGYDPRPIALGWFERTPEIDFLPTWEEVMNRIKAPYPAS